MNSSSIFSNIQSAFEGAIPCRTNGQTFLAIPTGDEAQPYVKVAVSDLLARDTKVNRAFDPKTAHAEYEAFIAKQEAKASAPKKTKAVNTEAVAKRAKQDEAVMNFFSNEAEDGKAYTATELYGLIEGFATVMEVGSAMNRNIDKGAYTMVMDNKKKTYIKA